MLGSAGLAATREMDLKSLGRPLDRWQRFAVDGFAPDHCLTFAEMSRNTGQGAERQDGPFLEDTDAAVWVEATED